MDAAELQDYLHEQIPLSKTIGIKVSDISGMGITLSAPLGPNSNHQGTVFAGSASAVALLSAWALLFVRLKNEGLDARGVVYRNTMTYDQPGAADFSAFAASPDAESWQRFLKILKAKKKARIVLQSVIFSNNAQIGKMEGEFVAILD